MPSIVRDDRDALQTTLTVNIARADYEEQFDNELQKYRKQANLKGFRKGKIPKSVLRKMFGRSILADVVNEVLQKHLFDYLQDEQIDVLGQPIPAEDQPMINFDPTSLEDYAFKFEVGMAPAFELKGLDEGKSFEYLVVTPDEEQLDEELMNLRRRMGQSEATDEPAEEKDILRFQAIEWDGKGHKEDGVEHEFTLFVENATDQAKEALIGKKKGDKVVLNVFELEADASEENVRKYMLGLEEGDDREVNPSFELEIIEVSRFAPAELNEEFYQQAFGEGDVSDEASAKERIAKDYRQHFADASNALLFRDFQDYLMELNPVELPDAFLKRWLVFTNEQNTPENVEKGYDGFSRGMQWTLLRRKLIEQFDLKVEA
ncbi:MAG: trigger factor, partial [Lewinella sp.]|nr:trigger factor [Lewinella sp.]